VNISNISNAVSDLLHFNECVTIPEFGAFVVNPSSAQLDMAKNRLTPPGKKVSFNKNITSNDGLLANAISITEGISHEDANIYIKAFVFELNTELKAKNVFEFHEIGTFYQSHENVLKFEPGKIESLGSFGLEQFHLTPLSAQTGFGKKAVVPHPGTLKTEIKYVNKTSTLGKIGWGLAVIPVIAYLVWVPANSGLLNKNKDFQLSNLNPFKSTPCEEYVARPAGLLDMDLSAKNLLHEDFNEVDYKFAAVESTNVVVVNPKVDLPLKYQIIGGCFRDKANAARLVAKLQDQGYSAKIFDKKGRLYRVTYGGFAHQKDARNALKKVKANANASAWLYRVN
jgi:nucleoid DNA-binding protein